MSIYISSLIMIGLYSLGYYVMGYLTKNKTKVKFTFVLLVTLQLILLLSLRHYSIGADVHAYISYFSYVSQYSIIEVIDSEQRFEIGYKILNKLVSIITTNEQVLLFVIASISIIPIATLIYKHSKMPFLSFAIYICFNYYAFTFSGLRQAIAYGIILGTYSLIKKRKLSKFLIIVFIASLFHQSALLFIPAYFVANLRLNKITISCIFIFNIVIFIFRKQIFGEILISFYDNYEIIESTSFTWMLVCWIIVICGLFFYKSVISINPNSNILYMLVIIGASLMIFSSVGSNVMRVADYYYMFVILFIPEVVSSIKDKRIVVMGVYVLILLLFILHLGLLNADGYNIVPYKFYWE